MTYLTVMLRSSAIADPFRRRGEAVALRLAVSCTLRSRETKEGAMPVMKGWFFPGLMDGYEFVYPAEESRTIARAETVVIPVSPRG